jgi:hypothetical protein
MITVPETEIAYASQREGTWHIQFNLLTGIYPKPKDAQIVITPYWGGAERNTDWPTIFACLDDVNPDYVIATLGEGSARSEEYVNYDWEGHGPLVTYGMNQQANDSLFITMTEELEDLNKKAPWNITQVTEHPQGHTLYDLIAEDDREEWALLVQSDDITLVEETE